LAYAGDDVCHLHPPEQKLEAAKLAEIFKLESAPLDALLPLLAVISVLLLKLFQPVRIDNLLRVCITLPPRERRPHKTSRLEAAQFNRAMH
jgi:hypothetical protein